MKNINFKITGNHVKVFDRGEIRVAKIIISFQEEDGFEKGLTFEFGSIDTDKEHFKDFIGHIKFKLREIFENAETHEDLIAAFEERFVKNYFHDYYIMDIK